ncbi:MAG: hypothetical protein WAW39_29865 [Prosthecobacter sp.]
MIPAMCALVTRSASSSPTQAEHESEFVECCTMNSGNVIKAAEFADTFDGFSIGTDRDNGIVVPVFNERNAAVDKERMQR